MLDTIIHAINMNKKVLINYNGTERVIWPLEMRGNKVFIAYCEWRESYRTFKIDSIVSCETLDETFNRDALNATTNLW